MNINKRKKNATDKIIETETRSKKLANRSRMILKARDKDGIANIELMTKAREIASKRRGNLNRIEKNIILRGKKLTKEQLIEQISHAKAKG